MEQVVVDARLCTRVRGVGLYVHECEGGNMSNPVADEATGVGAIPPCSY